MASTSNPYSLKIDALAMKYGVLAVTSTFEAYTLKETGTSLELLHIAYEARKFIQRNWNSLLEEVDKETKEAFGLDRLINAPYVLTALLASGRLYLCSSVRTNTAYGENFIRKLQGSNFTTDAMPVVLQTLREALGSRTPPADSPYLHANQANCGEVLAIYQWLTNNPGKELSDLWFCPMVSIAAEGNSRRMFFIIKEPCGPEQRNGAVKEGCNKLVPLLGTTMIATQDGVQQFKKDKVPETLNKIELGSHSHTSIVPETTQ